LYYKLPRDNDAPTSHEAPTNPATPHSPPSTSKQQEEKQQRRKKLGRQQQLLKQPCPECGRIYGSHVVVKSNRRSTKEILDSQGIPITKEIKRKYTTNPGPSEAYWAVKELHTTITTVAEMLPFVTKRYPSLLIRDADYAKALTVITKIWRPWSDERFSKDWISWFQIGSDASTYGYSAAASRNATEVRTTEGKTMRIKLTPEYIRDNLDVTYELAKDTVTYMPAYDEFKEVWNCIVSNDEVVRDEFLRMLERNKKNMYLASKDNTADDKSGGRGSYEYQYHYIIHYDPELYKHNKKSQGKKRCGPFALSEIRSLF
jgi:hypothetical protein